MPTYAYACTSCDHRFDAQQSFADATLTECPSCDGRVRKLFSSVGIVFKGSGFYRNDSRAKSSDGDKGSDGGKGADSGKGSTEKSAAKDSSSTPEKAPTSDKAPSTSTANGSASKSPATKTGSAA